MYDLHSHILHDTDDGPTCIEDAIEIARIAAANGTRAMLATPHRKDVTELSSVPRLYELAAELQDCFDDEGIPLSLYVGMENHMDESLPDDYADGKAITMNGTRYILVEMPFSGTIEEHAYADGVLRDLQAQGLTPVMAHPERIELFIRKPALLERYIGEGMLSQLTRGSLLGHYGEEIRLFSLELLRNGMAHMLASDTHSPRAPRTPELGEALQITAAIVGAGRAQAMVDDVPRAVLYDEPLDIASCGLGKVGALVG